ncbi:ATP-binding protein [Halobaculum sp. D14]|uniref:ATP-binding protein n=1 Tax=Halobaculum sp. D14 TaxID=3421642 RepID=UPI003EC0B3E5
MNAGNAADGGLDMARSLYAATEELMTAETPEAVCGVVVSAAKDILGFRLTGVNLRDGDALAPVAVTDQTRESYGGDPPTFRRGSDVWEVFEGGEPLWALDADGDHDWQGVVVPIGTHGVILAGADRDRAVDETRLELASLLADNTAVALDRLERERRLDELHKAARELMTARDTASVAAAATNTAHEVLRLRVNAVYLLGSDGDRLVPVSVTSEARDMFGDVTDIRPDGLAWRAFESGEAAVYDDVTAYADVEGSETPVRSELVVPLGDHGLFIAGSPDRGAFDDADVALAQVFADNVEAALGRAEREAVLRRRETALERQNDRLEEFASVVSHDLRNPLNVAQGRLELLMDSVDSPHLDHIEEAHGRMEALIEDLLALARTGRSVGETAPVPLPSLARDTWGAVSGGGDVAVDSALGTVDADDTRLRELLENLMRNAVEHGGSDVDVEVGRLADGAGFYVADDGPGIPEADRDDVFERGYTTEEDGTGFGLPIVREIARAHGWTVSVAGSDAGGARFEIRTGDGDGGGDGGAEN